MTRARNIPASQRLRSAHLILQHMDVSTTRNLGTTVLAKLVAKEKDVLGYITYVFECLDVDVAKDSRYVMCTRYPNWNHRNIELEEVGYLNFMEVKAGVDTWFDGNKMIPYAYNGVQFIKFIHKPRSKNYEYVM